MKKIIPIFLFTIICINHLNIIDAIGHYSAKYKASALQKGKEMPVEKETEKETEKEAKVKTDGEEKFWQKDNLAATDGYSLSGRAIYIHRYTLLLKNPYHDRDTKPPKLLA